jgi:hypothetical protein
MVPTVPADFATAAPPHPVRKQIVRQIVVVLMFPARPAPFPVDLAADPQRVDLVQDRADLMEERMLEMTT